MKLAFCLFNYFPFGGLQRDFLRIARNCHERGHEVHVYTMRWEGDQEPSFHLHLIAGNGLSNDAQCVSFANKIKPQLAAGKYDLIIGFNKMPGLDIYYAADVCYQARAQARRSFLYRLMPRYRRYVSLEKAVFAQGNHTEILLISPRQQQEFIRYYQTEPERFHLLSPGIDKKRFAITNPAERRKALREALNIPDDHFLLLMVGSGFHTKGVDRAIHALAALPEPMRAKCQLIVIGQDDPAVFIKLAANLQVIGQVHFPGGRTDVPDYLLAADVLLHPAYHENTGTVLLEAIVSGLPVLTVDVCGYAHYVSEANAGIVLASPFQQLELNSALQKMLSSSGRTAWRENGLAFAKEADIYDMPEKAANLIELAGRKRVSVSS